jgi:TldD protein
VVFTAGTAGVLMHELVGHMAESDVVTTGGSPLSELLGATITTTGIEIVDDPTRFDLPGAFNIDDEAMPAVPIVVVRQGRFERFLCDAEGGRALGCDPGRGRRSNWSRPPVARLSNLVISAGEVAPDDLEADLEHGLVVTRLGGATVDPVSSRIVLRIEKGWEIRHGRRRRPLASCELTGSVVEILANIDPRIGSDPTPDWRLGWCVKDGIPLPTGSEAPTLLVSRIEVL